MPQDAQLQQQPPAISAASAIPIGITEYPGPGTKGKQWLRIIKMYALEYNWSPAKFLEIAQVRATGDLYHKLEGVTIDEGATIQSVYGRIFDFIQPKTDLHKDLFVCQRDGKKPNESYEALASRVKVLMKTYAEATESKFGPAYEVNVFINMIKDEATSLRLREYGPKSLDDAVAFASNWDQHRKNAREACATPSMQQSFTTYRNPVQFNDPEPMEVDQLRFNRKPSSRRQQSNDQQRSYQQPRQSSSRRPTSPAKRLCFACDQPGHTGNNCEELRKSRQLIAKYDKLMAENKVRFDKTSRDSKARKFRRVTRLIQELDMEGAIQDNDESSDLSEDDDDEPIVAKNEDIHSETEPQDF